MDRGHGEECKKKREGKKIERLISSWKERMNDIKRLCKSKMKVHIFSGLMLIQEQCVSLKAALSASGLLLGLLQGHALSKHQSEILIRGISKSVLKQEKGQNEKEGNSVEEKMTRAYSFKSRILKHYISQLPIKDCTSALDVHMHLSHYITTAL